MKTKIWLRRGNAVAKAVWIKEAASGLYIGPSVGLEGFHYSYHENGLRHLTTAPGKHHRPKNDSTLLSVTDQRNVGGFSVEPSKLKWEPSSSLGKKNLVIDCDPDMRIDLPVLVSLHVSSDSHLPTFRERIRSAGPTHKDECVTFDLKAFPQLKGVVHVRYNTSG